MFSTPAFVPLDHDTCVTPVVRGCTPVMERPRPPAHPGARSQDHGLHARTTTTTTTTSALDEWHTPAPAQKTVAETTPGYVVYRAIPLHDGRAPKPKPAARRRQQLDGSAMARVASFTFDTASFVDTAAADERAPPASTSDGAGGGGHEDEARQHACSSLEAVALGRARKQLFEEHVRFRRANEPDSDEDEDDTAGDGGHSDGGGGRGGVTTFRGFASAVTAVPGASPAKRKGSERAMPSTGCLELDSSFDTDDDDDDDVINNRVSPDSVLETVATEAANARTKSPMKSPNKFARGAYDGPLNSPGKARRMRELARMHRAQQRRSAKLASSPLKNESSAATSDSGIDFGPIPSPGTEQIETVARGALAGRRIDAEGRGFDDQNQNGQNQIDDPESPRRAGVGVGEQRESGFSDARPPAAPRPGRLDGAANDACFGDVDAKPVRRTASRIAHLLGSTSRDDGGDGGGVDGLRAAMRRLEIPSARLEERFALLDADFGLGDFPESSFATPAPARKTAVAPMSVGT